MVRNPKTVLAFAALVLTLGLQPSAHVQDKAKTLETGTFHGKVHSTSGRGTIYQQQDGKLVLRLTSPSHSDVAHAQNDQS